jgi:hypothetical protein
MSITSLNEFIPLINQQIELQEALNHQLLKAKALADITISNDFLEHPNDTVQFYLLAMHDIVESSIKLSEESLNFMIKIVRDNTNISAQINL